MGKSEDRDSAKRLIERARGGDSAAIDALIGVIYPQLQFRARRMMRRDRRGHTLGTGSALVNEVLLLVLAGAGGIFGRVNTYEDLINVLSYRMRLLLVDYARAVKRQRNPPPNQRVAFEKAERKQAQGLVNVEDVLSVHELLHRLEKVDPAGAKAVELRFFLGLTNEEAAHTMGLEYHAFRRLLAGANAFMESLVPTRRTTVIRQDAVARNRHSHAQESQKRTTQRA